jgi:uncharacterized protein
MVGETFSVYLEGVRSEEALRLHCVRFSSGPQDKSVLITGALHGDEITSTGALWYLGERLARANLGVNITLIPCVNALGARASSRLVPLELSDINRCFPGRKDGSLAERLAAKLAEMLEDHDRLIDVHTAGCCIPFVLLDAIADGDLARRVAAWALTSQLLVVGEMKADFASLQGLDRSWSAYAIQRRKLAITMELKGFHTLDSDSAQSGSDAIFRMLEATAELDKASVTSAAIPHRLEQFANAGGFYESFSKPGEKVEAGKELGVIRSYSGAVKERVLAAGAGLILAIQPISAVEPGSWLITLSTS